MESNSITKLILGFLVLIVGLALIGSVAQGTNAVSDKDFVSGETTLVVPRLNSGACPMSIDPAAAINITNAPTGWKSSDCPITDFVMLNQTGVTTTVTTDYVIFGNNGSVYFKNTTAFILPNCSAAGDGTETANTTTVSYTYCGDDYLNIAWGRTVIDLVAGFFALALLMVSVALFYSVARDAGIIGK